MEMLPTDRRVQRVRHELRSREVTIASVQRLGTEFVRIVFCGDSLGDFVSLGFDDHVKLMIDDLDGQKVRRDYTPRRHDSARQRLTVDFAMHGHGKASEWARRAAVGQSAVIGGPRGSMVVPTGYDWHLLAGDATAAPAIGRRLAELPSRSKALVVAQLDDLAPLELEQSSAQIELRQVASGEELVAALRATATPPGQGYVWAAGEASVMKQVRDLMLIDKNHPREAMRVAAYWKRGALDYHEELGA